MLVSKHFKYHDELVKFVNENKILNIVSIAEAGRFSEGFVLFYRLETLSLDDIENNIFTLLTQFKNGKKLFHTSPTFNKVIQMLARGAKPLEVIEDLINNCDSIQQAFEKHLQR